MEKLKKYLPILIFSCKKTSELINKREVMPLSINERFILFYHNIICKTCNVYEKQSTIMENILLKSFKNKGKEHLQLSQEKKNTIIKILDEINNYSPLISINVRAPELIQYLKPVGLGPSLNTCPKCPSQRLHTTSTLLSIGSCISLMHASSIGS
jgi:hypothetical protein